ncbi:hypothetical protein PP793_001927 [Salmonella enterica]|nr:hypothetical protein [Salmonella enterica]ECC1575225.1 hypothetical protein [Salmonella enterica subsp. diarizonae]EGY9633386.1 hypothetical protein [Salmonella enterica subsp. enterica serovar Rough O:c:z]EIG1170479.1 hypothetical protein [Salmonella enterica subsp. diarizonae serovar 48:k:z53]EAP9280951.1 hypothetical protein [Salmonella enterica]
MKKNGILFLCVLTVLCSESVSATERRTEGVCVENTVQQDATLCPSRKKNKPKKRQTVSEKIVSDIRVKQAENSKKLEVRLKINQLRSEMWSPGRQGQRAEYEKKIRALEKILSDDNR